MPTGIYEIVNAANGGVYIGSAVDMTKRWHEHRSALRRGVHHSKFLQRAWKKYGEGEFSTKPLLLCSAENLLMYEQICLDNLRPRYNVCWVAGPMAHAGRKRSPETIARMVASWAGRALSERQRAHLKRMSEGNKGRAPVVSLEGRAKQAAAIRGRKRSEAAKLKTSLKLRGRTLTPEHSKKISEAKKGKKRPPFSEQWKANIGAARVGYKHSAESIQRMSDAVRARHARQRLERANENKEVYAPSFARS